jgi:AraC-like DNA-binding protein/mannose-6-phosphate isomerase-like protein (cupin superfamily)
MPRFLYEFPDQDFPQLTHFGYSDEDFRLQIHPHRHLGFELVFFVQGSASVRIMPGKETVQVGAEDVIITAPGILHGFELTSRGTAFYWLGFQPGPKIGRGIVSTLEGSTLLPKEKDRTQYFEDPRFSLSPFLERIHVQDFRIVKPVPEAGFLFRRMEDEIRSDQPFRQAIIHLSILELLSYLERRIAGPLDTLERVRAFLDAHCTEKMDLSRIAEYAGFDPAYLCRVFKARYRLPPIAYARRARLDEAKRLIASGSTAGNAARRCGYTSAQQFSTVFRKATGQSPSDYAATVR